MTGPSASAYATALAVTALLAAPCLGAAHDGFDGVKACLGIEPASARLECFERETRKLIQPRFAGRLGAVSEPFDVTLPTRIRYQSDGAIFVLYLKTADDQVVQNIHLGGGGEGTYMIEKPGRYFLQIDGSETWRIWLEPQGSPMVQN